ncbi:MAG: hypothetical protein CL760_00175 [Chloroflexi bacterium]|nr:hypothetical protein [Chloroflexota bacterium]|tara:strand:+ start:73428 stop:73607 length:180 start_codon:yes stop_codon:yes gene_type:complete
MFDVSELTDLMEHEDNLRFEKRFSEWDRIDIELEKAKINFNEEDINQEVLKSIISKDNF